MVEEHDHEYRTGIGSDIHRFAEGRKLMLGGVFIPFPQGLARPQRRRRRPARGY